MGPVLIHPIQFVRACNLARRRAVSTLLFVAGYTAVWSLVGSVMLLLTARLTLSGLPQSAAAGAILLGAFIWQCSPAKQVCLNSCHALAAPAVFGNSANSDIMLFGATQGMWCAGSCWAWMLLPQIISSGHIITMAAATMLIFCERLDDPVPVGWRFRGLGRARNIVVARLKSPN
jgi:predicted metal-binding membrane protein